MNILTAAKFRFHIQNIGMERTTADNLVMCRSYLVSIDEESTPIPYFPTLDRCLAPGEDISIYSR